MQSLSPRRSVPPQKPLRVLLWAPRGSSEQYHGPGSFAFRLYSSAPDAALKITLAHGNPEQPPTEVYQQQHFVAPFRAGTANMLQFLHQGKRWIRKNFRDFDVLHGLGGYHYTMAPAYLAHQLGLPSVIFVALQGDEFTDKSGIKSLLGLPQKRRRMLREMDAVIAMSQAIEAELRQFGVSPQKIARIPMGVNATRFAPSSNCARKVPTSRTTGPAGPTYADFYRSHDCAKAAAPVAGGVSQGLAGRPGLSTGFCGPRKESGVRAYHEGTGSFARITRPHDLDRPHASGGAILRGS